MALFDNVLLAVDYDRTLTAPDSTIPARNLEAIEYFKANGGTFTLNTGRSTTTMRDLFQKVPVNAPFLLYNGSAFWENGKLTNLQLIDLPMWEVLNTLHEAFPEMNLEIQAADNHYLVDPKPEYIALYEKMKWSWAPAVQGEDYGPFIKLAIYGQVREISLADQYRRIEGDDQRYAQLIQFISDRWGDKVDTFLATPRVLDIQGKGVSKGNAAVKLKQLLGKKILVCMGDAENDISMMHMADYAFCPSDATIADRYENVCKCGDGAVADVIYEKIPEILGIQP